MSVHFAYLLYSRSHLWLLPFCRGSVRLYSDFYESDIIVASPLALATKLSEDEEEGGQQRMRNKLALLKATSLQFQVLQ